MEVGIFGISLVYDIADKERVMEALNVGDGKFPR
jgi:hypothetical protein